MSSSTPNPSATPRRPTIRDVAALAGVGIKTVSRVINREPNVSAGMIEKVTRAAAQLNYEPDVHAGNLKRRDKRTRTLGLLVGSVANPFVGQVHRAIEDVASQRGVVVFASSTDDDPEREKDGVSTFVRRRVDGLILTTASYLLPAQTQGMPLVFVDRAPVAVDVDTVGSDHVGGAVDGARHLLDQGHREIAFLGLRTTRERREGFFQALGEVGVPTSGLRIVDDLYDEESARVAAHKLLRVSNGPTAIFSAQNLLTIGAVRALREEGAQHSVALVGFDDFPLSDLVDPAVTVVAQHPSLIGRLAAERMFARLDGDDSPPSRHLVPTTLIQRGSGEIPPHPRAPAK